jgi:hypothetical protein
VIYNKDAVALPKFKKEMQIQGRWILEDVEFNEALTKKEWEVEEEANEDLLKKLENMAISDNFRRAREERRRERRTGEKEKRLVLL